jgi:pimeloyl-ACP methyl ester carboxylesterase
MLARAEVAWGERWAAPDLPGHGLSRPAADYAPESVAGAISQALRLPSKSEDVVVLGHSFGAVVGLALASGRFGFTPRQVLAIGVKVEWTAAELEAMRSRASTPPKCFASQDAAVQRYLKVSGLLGLVDPTSSMALSGVRQTEHGWRLAMEPGANDVGLPPMSRLTSAASSPVVLACGERDPLTSADQLRQFDSQPQVLAGLGHNAMVEDPDAVWRWFGEATQGGDAHAR